MHGLGFMHQVLAIGEVASDLLANHHGKLIDGQFGRRSIMPPVVVVSSADSVQLVRMFVLDSQRQLLSMEDVRPLGPKVDLFLVDESRDDGLLVTVIPQDVQQQDYGLIRGEVIG